LGEVAFVNLLDGQVLKAGQFFRILFEWGIFENILQFSDAGSSG